VKTKPVYELHHVPAYSHVVEYVIIARDKDDEKFYVKCPNGQTYIQKRYNTSQFVFKGYLTQKKFEELMFLDFM